MKANIRIGELELRINVCPTNIALDRAEIGKLYCTSDQKEAYMVIAYWQKDDEGHDLKFFGDRPFLANAPQAFMKLANIGQQLLKDY